MWDEIASPFPNFNGATVEVWEWISTFISHFSGHVITSGIKVNACDKTGPNYTKRDFVRCSVKQPPKMLWTFEMFWALRRKSVSEGDCFFVQHSLVLGYFMKSWNWTFQPDIVLIIVNDIFQHKGHLHVVCIDLPNFWRGQYFVPEYQFINFHVSWPFHIILDSDV